MWELPNWEGEGCYMQDHLGVQKGTSRGATAMGVSAL